MYLPSKSPHIYARVVLPSDSYIAAGKLGATAIALLVLFAVLLSISVSVLTYCCFCRRRRKSRSSRTPYTPPPSAARHYRIAPLPNPQSRVPKRWNWSWKPKGTEMQSPYFYSNAARDWDAVNGDGARDLHRERIDREERRERFWSGRGREKKARMEAKREREIEIEMQRPGGAKVREWRVWSHREAVV